MKFIIMKFGFDIHGVVDSLPEVFSVLTNLLVEAGHEVHILTGSKWSPSIEDDLRKMSIKWTHHFSITDHHISIGTPMRYDPNPDHPWIDTGSEDQDNILWDKSKADYCELHGIHLHIDDTKRYNDYFATPFARMWTHNNKPKPSYKSDRHME